jgi:hypothetical protein
MKDEKKLNDEGFLSSCTLHPTAFIPLPSFILCLKIW